MELFRTCKKCGQSWPMSGYRERKDCLGGRSPVCKECQNRYGSAQRAASRERRREAGRIKDNTDEGRARIRRAKRRQYKTNHEKCVARVKLGRAVRLGKIQREPCAVCGNPETQAHHDDYSKPFDVRWLCFVHHQEVHGHTGFKTPRDRHGRRIK